MSTYLVTAKTISKARVIDLQGASLGFREVQEVIRKLKEKYNAKNSGWRLETWAENRQGSRLLDFEMVACSAHDPENVFQCSVVEQDRPVRRYR